MTLLRRQKLIIILLVFYWPAIFILTHIPMVSIPMWVIQTNTNDKILHYLVYLILVFLLWLAINPNEKVNWGRTSVWWVLLVVVWYGVFDEWLQSYVGRSCDIADFLADLAGTLTGLILLSFFSFWSASLVLTGAAIFILTNFMQANPDLLPTANVVFHLVGYAFFSLLWTRYMCQLLPAKAPQLKWLIGASAIPIVFLLSVETFSVVAGNGLEPLCVIASVAAITAVISTIYMIALFGQNFAEKMP